MNSFLGSLKAKVGLGRGDDNEEPDNSTVEDSRNRMNDNAQPQPEDGDEGFDFVDESDGQDQEQESTFDDSNHMYVQGVDLGRVNPGAISNPQDVLNMLHIDERVEVPEDVYLPQDLQEGRFRKFDDENPGFSKEQVVAFFDRTQLSAEYLQKMLNRRTQDIMKLVKYINELSSDLQEKMVESEVQQSSGMNLIAGDDNQTIITLTKKNQNLQAQLDAYRNGSASAEDSGLKDEFSDLKKRYDKLQDQLGLEQYTNKELSKELDDLKSRMAIKDEESGNDLDRLTENINEIDSVDVPDIGGTQEIELDDRPSRKMPRRVAMPTSEHAGQNANGASVHAQERTPQTRKDGSQGHPSGGRPRLNVGGQRQKPVQRDDRKTPHHKLSLKSARPRSQMDAESNGTQGVQRKGAGRDTANGASPQQIRQVKVTPPKPSQKPNDKANTGVDDDVISFD